MAIGSVVQMHTTSRLGSAQPGVKRKPSDGGVIPTLSNMKLRSPNRGS